MRTSKLNHLNTGLIVLALALALVVPFELLMLSYAVLGPLHYVTEISWLHDRDYYLPRRYDWTVLWLITIAAVFFLPDVFFYEPVVARIPVVGPILTNWRFDIAFVAFAAAFVMVVSRSGRARLAWAAVVGMALVAFRSEPLFIRIFAAYLPSLIHVCVFTGLFLLHGALKSRDVSGYVTLGAFVAAGGLAWFLPDYAGVTAGEWVRKYFGVSFAPLTRAMLYDVGVVNVVEARWIHFFEDPRVVAVVRFLAFSYLYHYLNWFSKTSLIGWHRVSAGRAAYIVAIWSASVGLYVIDYRLGMTWLFLLSFGHFVLELPLNHRTIHGIADEIRARVAWPTTAPETSPAAIAPSGGASG